MAILHAGIATFLQAPPVEPDREALAEAGATVAVLGLPYDSTTVTRPGASHGPRAIRDASSHFSFGGGYHLDYDVTISDHLTLADCGDVDGAPGPGRGDVRPHGARTRRDLCGRMLPGPARRRPRDDDSRRARGARHMEGRWGSSCSTRTSIPRPRSTESLFRTAVRAPRARPAERRGAQHGHHRRARGGEPEAREGRGGRARHIRVHGAGHRPSRDRRGGRRALEVAATEPPASTCRSTSTCSTAASPGAPGPRSAG